MIPPERLENVKTIGLISDTHVPSKIKTLPVKIHDIFKGVDAIIHAGDFTNRDVIFELESIAPLYGVLGNSDGYEIELPVQRLILINDTFLVAACHGAGMHSTTKERMYQRFKERNPTAIIYGHTHLPSIETIENTLMVNPGSPSTDEPSVGLLKISENVLKAEIIRL